MNDQRAGLVAAIRSPLRPDRTLNLDLVKKQAEHLVGYGFTGAAKAMVKLLGVDAGPARLRSQLEETGFFEWIM